MEIKERIEKVTGLPQTIFEHVMDFASFLIRQIEDEYVASDEPEAWVSDLQDLDLIKKGDADHFLAFAATVCSTAEAVHRQKRGRSYEAGVLPALSSAGATVELRGVFDKTYHWPQPVNEFNPELLGVAPIISVHIGLDSGNPNEIAFQASVEETEFLIAILQAALADNRKLLSTVDAKTIIHDRTVQDKS